MHRPTNISSGLPHTGPVIVCMLLGSRVHLWAVLFFETFKDRKGRNEKVELRSSCLRCNEVPSVISIGLKLCGASLQTKWTIVTILAITDFSGTYNYCSVSQFLAKYVCFLNTNPVCLKSQQVPTYTVHGYLKSTQGVSKKIFFIRHNET